MFTSFLIFDSNSTLVGLQRMYHGQKFCSTPIFCRLLGLDAASERYTYICVALKRSISFPQRVGQYCHLERFVVYLSHSLPNVFRGRYRYLGYFYTGLCYEKNLRRFEVFMDSRSLLRRTFASLTSFLSVSLVFFFHVHLHRFQQRLLHTILYVL